MAANRSYSYSERGNMTRTIRCIASFDDLHSTLVVADNLACCRKFNYHLGREGNLVET